MPEMHLIKPGPTYSSCAPFTKNKKEQDNLKEYEIQDTFTYRN